MGVEEIGRRDFAFKVIPSLLAGGVLAACERRSSEAIHRIEGGEAADLPYFRLSNGLSAEYAAYIFDKSLEELAVEFGVPLYDSRSLEIAFLPETETENHGVPNFKFVEFDVSPAFSKISIRLGELIGLSKEAKGGLPLDGQDMQRLSFQTSLFIFLGLFEVACQKGEMEMTRDEFLEMQDGYVNLSGFGERLLIARIAIGGNAPPGYFL